MHAKTRNPVSTERNDKIIKVLLYKYISLISPPKVRNLPLVFSGSAMTYDGEIESKRRGKGSNIMHLLTQNVTSRNHHCNSPRTSYDHNQK